MTGTAVPETIEIPTVTKDTLNTALANTGVVIEEDVVQEDPITAVSVSVTTTGDAAAPVLADLSAAVSAKVAADTGISATDLVVVEAEVVVEATTAAPVAAAPVMICEAGSSSFATSNKACCEAIEGFYSDMDDWCPFKGRVKAACLDGEAEDIIYREPQCYNNTIVRESCKLGGSGAPIETSDPACCEAIEGYEGNDDSFCPWIKRLKAACPDGDAEDMINTADDAGCGDGLTFISQGSTLTTSVAATLLIALSPLLLV